VTITDIELMHYYYRGLSDSQIGHRLGYHYTTIHYRRKLIGLRSRRKVVDLTTLQDLHAQGLNDVKIARIMGVTSSAVGAARRRIKLDVNWLPSPPFTEEEKAAIYKLHSEGCSIMSIARRTGYNKSKVRLFCRNEGLDTSLERGILYKQRKQIGKQCKNIQMVIRYLSEQGPTDEKELVARFDITKTTLMALANNNRVFRLRLFLRPRGRLSGSTRGKASIGSGKTCTQIRPTYVIRGDERIADYIVSQCPFTIDDRREAAAIRHYLAEFIGIKLAREVIERLGYKYQSKFDATGTGSYGGKFAPLDTLE
jgi:hypothetical protein